MAHLLLASSSLSAVAPASLADALAMVEARLDGWAANTSAYNDLLLQVFAGAGTEPAAWQQAADALQTTLQSSGLAIGLELLSDAELSGINGAYSAQAPSGGAERLFLNTSWLQVASTAEIEAVLLEELGHAIDTRLNGTTDSPGDEGERFSALLRGVVPPAASFSENDQRQLSQGGLTLAIEAADTSAPVARAMVPAFAAAATNPFGLADVGSYASPRFVDIDGDGDLDAFIGNGAGNTLFFRNTATPGGSATAFAADTTTSFGLTGAGSFATPTFVDIDGDGDLDALIGNRGGNTVLFRNTATPGSTSPAFAAASTNPFGLGNVGYFASPSFVDIDRDGDLDAVIGDRFGSTRFFRNTALQGASSPAFAAASTNTFGLTNVGSSFASPSFVDIDSDGDLDAFIGIINGNIVFFRNNAAPSSSVPAFTSATINPFGLTDVGSFASPNLVDIDGDGDLDAFVGNSTGRGSSFIRTSFGNTLFFRNTAPVLGVSSSTANGTYGPGAVVTLTVRFSEAVLVSGSPRLQLETGATNRFATFSGGSGTNTLSFSYTVQPGDTSTDLDVLSASALTLNGGTIRDVAGNNAVLTLATPGSPASLGARKNLEIAGAVVSGVSSPTANGTYASGALINIRVTFSQAVLVTGNPRLLLETGDTDRFATYTSGSSTNVLTFSYTVQPGDSSADLDVASIHALSLNGGTIKDVAFGNNASLRLPAPGAPGSLATSMNLVVDAVRPVALTKAPAFVDQNTNPFGLVGVRFIESPNLLDIDGDGDLDAFIRAQDGNTVFLRNTAAPAASVPVFVPETNPFGVTDVGTLLARSNFVDIDQDGDLDAFISDSIGNLLLFRNTAAPGSTIPAFVTANTSSFTLTNENFGGTLSLVDIDGDGDLDAFLGKFNGNTLFIRNTAASGSTIPAFANASTNPFGLTSVGRSASPSFVDIDDDGDLDAFIGQFDGGNTRFFRNIAAPGSSDPAFAAPITTPFGLFGISFNASPNLVDIDGDGDLDAFVAYADRATRFFRNTAPVLGLSSTTANGTYGLGAVITFTLRFSEAVIVNTAGGSPHLMLETGSTDRFATFTGGSGTNTLTFAYTVQPGDTSSDLDVRSASALMLNGATIRDAAGNNAVLTLAAPGSPGSLSAKSNLVIDAARPVALSTAPAFAAAVVNPFGLFFPFQFSGTHASPNFVDIDADGDLDAFIGQAQGRTLFFRNTAAPGASTPAFAPATSNFGLADGGFASPSFVDIDGDGDLDAFIGNRLGNTLFFRNTAPLGASTPAFAPGSANRFRLSDVGYQATPSFVDIDGDGDLDAFIGNSSGNILFFRNTAAAGATSPAFAEPTTNPFGLITAAGLGQAAVGSFIKPTFVDIDGDGDLDVFIGNSRGNTVFFRNTATPGASAPAFAATTTNPFGLTGVGSFANPSFADIDGDGDLDAFIGNRYGNTLFFRNTAPALGVSSTTANGSYGAGAVISLRLRFSEAVIVNTAGGSPRLLLETGSTDRFATFAGGSGTNTLTFSYTVQPGDTSTDLDVRSAGALTLNGATIRDAAGNNAVLTLAAPGSPASLAARKNLVIDTTAPLITAGPAAVTAPGVNGFSLAANEAVTAALRRDDNSLLFFTPVSANTSTLLTLAARPVVTSTSLVITDRAGNRTTSATTVLLGTNNADTFSGTANADLLYGFLGNDSLTGFGGNDTLIGAAGIDTLTGGDGHDAYVIGTNGDLVVETNADATTGGIDTVFSSFLAYTLTANVENLTLTGAAITGTGNALNNRITGNAANNSLFGAGGNDTLIGSGDGGIDTLTGGDGNDTYLIGTNGDLVVESNANAATGGIDTVLSSLLAYTLTTNVENLTLTAGALDGTGNALNNIINGTAAANSLNGAEGNDILVGFGGEDTLIGGAGNDTLTGGLGADTFRFDSPLNGVTNRDRVTDFSFAQGDRIELENNVFTTLTAPGVLAPAFLFTGAAATNASHRILYNSATGVLAYDSDGTGAAAAIAFATLSPGLALTNNSFTVT